MSEDDPQVKHQANVVKQRMRLLVGASYPKLEQELDKLSFVALVELTRFVSDAAAELSRVKNQARNTPWRR